MVTLTYLLLDLAYWSDIEFDIHVSLRLIITNTISVTLSISI